MRLARSSGNTDAPRDDSGRIRTADDLERAFREGAPLDGALREAALTMLLAHRRDNQPVVIERQGQLVELEGEALDREIAILRRQEQSRDAA